ncbi:DNA polymerase III subunit gamma and tau [Streptomyces sp. NPDC002701]|uniref:DNA polymerase III subunit gamma and tau n=1 Tax=Streptomyces sp. NPDC002701 TaxID=3364661 RepID=UPI00369D013E
MSSLALYRRYRPESFAEVIGQEHVTDPLMQALRNNRVNHAYLFSGPRGCGKTTSARILARCLNCEQGPTPTPCGECQSCRDLARNGPGSIDVIEIDAASHGGVDDARDLREKAFFGPASSRYKIYIIDEAHMVTSAGFNALLKVVEEPPEHLKFIFATTEPEKVIGTIRSRTHHYPFRLVPPGTLREYLAEVCGREGMAVEDGVLPLVVRAGAGSVRDSMSVMDQLLAGAREDGVTYAMATSLLGYTDGSLLDSVVEAFAAGDGAAAFEVVDRVIEGGNDPRRFVADLLERLRDLVILAAVPDAGEKGLIDAPVDVVERMTAQASVFGAAELSRAADLVNTGLTEMRGATSPRLQLELICARVLLPAAYGDERSVMARLDRIERGVNFTGAGAGAGAGAPAVSMGYVPGPDAHAGPGPGPGTGMVGGMQGGGSASVVPPGGGVAAARAAVRGAGPGTGAGAGQGHGPSGGAGGPVGADGGSSGSGDTGHGAPHAPAAAASAPPPAPAPAPAPAAPTPPAAAPPGAGQPPAPAPAAGGAPGAWPTPTAAGSGRRPGGWPTTAAAGGGQPSSGAPGASTTAAPGGAGSSAGGSGAAQSSASYGRPPAPTGAPAPQSAGGSAPFASPSGGPDPRTLWPNILEAVKNRRRFTWILLSQNAQVTGFDGTTLQLGFVNVGARDNFASSGSEEVLRQALSELFNVQWKIEAVIDPSGGSAPPPSPGAGFGGGGGGGGGYASGGAGGAVQQGAPRPAPQQPAAPAPGPSAPSGQDRPTSGSGSPSASAHRPAPRPSAPEPPPISPEDDIPEDDDPDLDESALSGHELIVRELGATVVEEFANE